MTAAQATLAHERRFGGLGFPRLSGVDEGRALDEARAETAELAKVYSWYPQRAGRVDLVVDHARAAGVQHDPVVRDAIARLLSMQRVSEWTAERARAARATGRPPGPEGSIGKLALSHVAREAARVHAHIGGAHAMLAGADPESLIDGVVAEVLVSVPAQSIAGGTDEIQRNIIGERSLGLPREPDPTKGVPYRDARRGGAG